MKNKAKAVHGNVPEGAEDDPRNPVREGEKCPYSQDWDDDDYEEKLIEEKERD